MKNSKGSHLGEGSAIDIGKPSLVYWGSVLCEGQSVVFSLQGLIPTTRRGISSRNSIWHRL